MNFSNQLLMYVGHLSSPVSLNKAVVVGASWHKNKSFILILSVEFKCNTLEKIISVLYTSTTIFSLPLLVFSLSQLLFLFLIFNFYFLPISSAFFTFTDFSAIWPVHILQRLVKICDSLWSGRIHVSSKFFNLVRFNPRSVFSSLCFVRLSSSLLRNLSKFFSTSLHLCWNFAHVRMVLGFVAFPIIPVGPFLTS